MNVLVIDDARVNLRFLENQLEGLGYQVTTAPSGETALEILTSPHDIDVALSDLNMPDMDGVELFRQYETYCAHAGIAKPVPFIMLTASHKDDRLDAAREIGFFAIMSKPPELSKLAENIERAFESTNNGVDREQFHFARTIEAMVANAVDNKNTAMARGLIKAFENSLVALRKVVLDD
ncbi:MAG: response regulator [Candidatus Marinimicrobia bacterium]|nr:response regulator [Candidatus Neomarinimicrobiota bacterium]